MASRWVFWFTALALICGGLPDASAQITTATLGGTVVDQSNAVLPGVTLTATDMSTGRIYTAVTDDLGHYRIVNISPSTYRITAELQGFGKAEVRNVELMVGQNATLPFTLKVATVEENVTVTGETPLVDTRSSQVTGNIDRRQMEQVPLAGRNWMSLAMLVKGITANDVSTNPGVSRDELFQLNMDGQQVTQKTAQARYGQPKFSREAIAEFQVVTEMFDITQGRSTGIQVQAITKSGTNSLSGSAFGFFRDSKLNAPDHILDRVLPYSDQQVGGTLGGPVLKDRLFFFGSYEYEREPSTAVSTPVFLPGEVFAFPTQNTYNAYLARGDYQRDHNNHLTVRYSRSSLANPFANTAGDVFPSRASVQDQHSTNVLGQWSSVIRNNIASELRVGYSAFLFANLSPPYMYGVRSYVFPGLTVGGQSNQPNSYWSATYSFRYDLNWFKNTHNFKIGGEFLRVHDRGYWYNVAFGNMIFNSRPADLVRRFPADSWNNPAAWDLTGLDSYAQRLDINFRPDWNNDLPRPTVGVWLGDNWRLTNQLTLNAGIRWDADFGVANPPDVPESTILIDNGRVSGDFGYKNGHTDLDNIAPRVGFVYKPAAASDFVIRGGSGLYYNFAASNVMYIKQLFATMVSAQILNDGQPGWVPDPLRGKSGSDFLSGKTPLPPQNKTVLDPYFQNPVTWQYSLGLQKQLGPVMAFDADLIGWKFTHDQRNNDVNLFYDSTTGYNKDPRTYGRPNPAYGYVATVTGTGKRDYLGLATSFTRRLKDRFQAGATYTLMFYQHDDNLGGSGALGSSASNPFDNLAGEWATSTDFQRHTVRAYALYQMSWGISLSGLYLYGSGNRFATTLSSLGYNGGGANRLNLGAPITIPAATAGRFDGPPVIATGAVVPRNGLEGLPLQRVDLRITKDIKLHGDLKLSLIGEVFNLTDHANYGSYNGVVDSPTFGQPLAVYSFSGLGTAYVPRTGQLAFRVSF
jgi:hypothetical protein